MKRRIVCLTLAAVLALTVLPLAGFGSQATSALAISTGADYAYCKHTKTATGYEEVLVSTTKEGIMTVRFYDTYTVTRCSYCNALLRRFYRDRIVRRSVK
ncbi:hypothetical protein AGMMS49992_33510 [Clostridia bacterium]|nr:hypothetical protein AGMMS49992_33510 [Clostridia bacterium]